VKTPLLGGINAVDFNTSFSDSDVDVVRVAMDPNRDGELHDAALVGTAVADRIRIGGSPDAGVVVTGLGPTEIVTGASRFTIRGDGGDDLIDAGGLAAGTVGNFLEFGGSGNDTLTGHPGNDELGGEDGDDRLEGRGGDDILVGGPGNNIIIP
jgi:Ca2+-binding RTX toxin-like protein